MKKLVILGGGTTGCITAAALARQLPPELYQITVLESSHISSTGVGESVLPSLISFLRKFGLDEQEIIQKTGAGIKLGTRFRGWCGNDDSFFHPLGTLGSELNGHDFFDCWLKARSRGDSTPLQDYAPSSVMASEQRFDFPGNLPTDSPLTGAKHAFHLDAGLVSRFLRDFAEQHEVRFIEGHVVRFSLGETGGIESLELNNRQVVEGDFFIDCSGLRGLLIDEALNSSYESWSHFLPCDRAVVVHTQNRGVIAPYTLCTAKESGWTWRIPLQEWTSSGYVFASEHSSDRQAIRVLLDACEGEALQEPQFIPIRNGMRNQLWKKNCIALGIAGGFLEPLESTAIHLAIRGVESMLELFPNLDQGRCEWPELAAEYNRRMRAEFEEIRDFIILHYHTSRRTDTEFWRLSQSMPVPDSLVARVKLFEARAELQVTDRHLFGKTNWQSVLVGMGVIPRAWHPFVDTADFNSISHAMQAERTRLGNAVGQVPDYGKFLSALQANEDE